MLADPVVDAAVAEAQRRAAASDRDLWPDVEHYTATLPEVLDRLRLRPIRWYDGGAGLPPLAVVREDGVPALLKLARPGTLDRQAGVLRSAEGRGYVRVLEWDPGRGALLLERLGETLWQSETTVRRQVEVILPLLEDAWNVPLSAGTPFSGKAIGLRRILADLGPRYGGSHPQAVRLATTYAESLVAGETPQVVCHGDAHALNVLRRDGGQGEAWALIDPDGFVGERAYDLGVLLRDGCREIVAAEEASPGDGLRLLQAAATHLADVAHLGDAEAERVWRWAFVERVTTGLYLHWHGHPDQAASFLTTADLVADHLTRRPPRSL